MNERIRLFAEQAGAVTFGGKICLFGDQDIEKFAELIVKECIDVISPYAVRMENFDGGHPISDLKEHFGVEE